MTERTGVRARGLGYDWHNVMHLVMGPVTEAVYETLAEKRPFDRADYLWRLAELPGAGRHQRNSAHADTAAGSSHVGEDLSGLREIDRIGPGVGPDRDDVLARTSAGALTRHDRAAHQQLAAQTPQGSLRSSAPARQASLARHLRHIAFACHVLRRLGEEQLRILRARQDQAQPRSVLPADGIHDSLYRAVGRALITRPPAGAFRPMAALHREG